MINKTAYFSGKTLGRKRKGIRANSRSDIVIKAKRLPMSKRSNSRLHFLNDCTLLKCKRSQVTIFIILAIAIVAVIVLFYAFKSDLFKTAVPSEFEPVYSYYISCVKEETSNGALLLGQTGGYINLPEFSPGSVYMPFSSQLDFLGTGVPYWYYISGNGVVKEQAPSLEKMQSQLNDYLNQRLLRCDFSRFEQQGFVVEIGNADVESKISDNSIGIEIKQDLKISYGDAKWETKENSVSVDSHLGKFFNLAQKIYSNQKQTMFLENYGVDILRLYAPVDGSDISCAPKIWQVNSVRENLMNALEANVPATKIKGSYYNLKKSENKYFVRDIGENSDVNVNFMYSKTWPMKLEVWPNEDGILRANPVGLQEGLGMLGFCYVPYHFVYDFAYPVLIQIYSNGREMFQFSVVVYINKNVPRQALDGEALPDVVPELCDKKLANMSVTTYNTNLEPVEADIRFKCFDTVCDIGKTSSGTYSGNFPQCVNGFIIASADGYETAKYQTTGENNVMIVMNKKYKLDLNVQRAGEYADYAVVVFSKNNTAGTTVSYPEQKQVELTEGQYKVKVYIYSNSSINLKGSQTEKCVDVPKSGVLGVFGATEKKCFTITTPDQIVSFAVSGGGVQNYYASESELEKSKKITINTESFIIPRTVEDLQANFNSLDLSRLDVRFE